MKQNSFAQGTIEYLVIIAIVVVLCLVIVGLVITTTSAPSQQITDSSSTLGNVSSGGISIVEAVSDLDGDSLVKLGNNYGEFITMTKITLCNGVENSYAEQLVDGDSKLFGLSSVACTGGEKTKDCEIKLEYTTREGVAKIEYKTVKLSCVDNSIASGGRVVNPIDNVAPIVLLNSPSGTLNIPSVDFDFNVIEANAIPYCSINLGGATLPVGSVNSGKTIVHYDFLSDAVLDWNVSCTDASGNLGVSSSLHLIISTDSTPPEVALSSPADGDIFTGRDLVFNFSATDESGIDSCVLNIGSDSNTYTNLTSGANTITYTKGGNDGLFDWNITCSDGANSTTSASRRINMDASAYQISYCGELQRMTNDLDGDYELMNDVDCGLDTNNVNGSLWNGGYGFNPVGNSTSNFTGQFNGNGYSIDSLYINRPLTSYIGLFGFIYQGSVSNLGLTNANITGFGHIGGIVGDLNNGSIINSYSTGKVKLYDFGSLGNVYVGGIAGLVYMGSISNSYSLVDVNGLYYTGGIAGILLSGTFSNRSFIINSYYSGNVDSNKDYAGGIAGGVVTLTAISNCYSSGTVHSRLSRAGGLVGDIGVYSQFSLSNSFSTSRVSASSSYVGGLIGSGLSTGTVISNSYWDKTLTGQNNCYYNGSTNCSFTTNTPSYYYSSTNVPLSNWTWGADGNWTTTATYPKLSWQD